MVFPGRKVRSEDLEVDCRSVAGQLQRPFRRKDYEPQVGVSPSRPRDRQRPALPTEERPVVAVASLHKSLYETTEPRAERGRKVLTVSFYFALNKR